MESKPTAFARNPAGGETPAKAARTAGTRSGRSFGVATGAFPVERARGRKLLYRGWIKTEDLRGGWAGLWWRCDVGSGSQVFDDMQDRGPRGTTDWQRFEVHVINVTHDTRPSTRASKSTSTRRSRRVPPARTGSR